MERPDALRVREDRVLFLHADQLAVLLVDVLQTGDRCVVLDEPDAGSEWDDDGDVEGQIAFATFLAGRERAKGHAK